MSSGKHLLTSSVHFLGFPCWLSAKESTCQCRRHGFDPWVRKIPWRRKWQLTPVFLPRKSHEQRSLAGYSPWGSKRVGRDLATKQPPFGKNGCRIHMIFLYYFLQLDINLQCSQNKKFNWIHHLTIFKCVFFFKALKERTLAFALWQFLALVEGLCPSSFQ